MSSAASRFGWSPSCGVGSVVGLAAGVAFGRFVEALLFQVTPTDIVSLAVPIGVLTVAAALAALPAAIRAVRIDPAKTLRPESLPPAG